ncbi:O-antigen ligase family protein [Paludifilum halophilum]|uniref:O-antigen ligase-related domain-containing protein n=1 Tax=Paludifilum halophilum TaxID=1642702 RepID=A0A235B729_9BACL|nr:O-antigen ligase family protein [Paludifilum halophilum]OYD08041.1 hypothetical protein CHM34_07970 [Paludifilum halophilum]
MSSLLLPGQRQLNRLFHWMVVFAVLGPTLGFPLPGSEYKMTLFRIAFILLAAGLTVRWVRENSLPSSHMYPVRWYPAFFAFWLIYAAVSLTWVGHMGYGLRYVIFLGMMLLLCLSFPYFLKTIQYMQKMAKVLFGVFATIVVYGLIEAVTYWHLPASRYEFGEVSPNPTSFFTNQNDFATAITLGLPFLVTGMYMIPIHRKTKGWIYATGIIALCCLFLTGSRSNSGFALPLAAVAWAALVPVSVERKKLSTRNVLRGLTLLSLAAVIVSALLSSVLSQQTRDKLESTRGIFQDIQGSWELPETGEKPGFEEPASEDKSISIRVFLIRNGLQFLQNSHFLGVGAGNVEYYMKGAPGVEDKKNMHNWWMEILVNFGILIFVLYMAFYLWMLWRLFRLSRVKVYPELSPFVRWGAVSSLVALVGYVFGGMSPSTAIHFTPMWIVYGFALTVIAVGERQKEKRGWNAPA